VDLSYSLNYKAIIFFRDIVHFKTALYSVSLRSIHN
jgi:hypothetical protein